ncbi:MAG: DNA mismatch repair protein MutS, partial [Halobacteriaceae archaeon]
DAHRVAEELDLQISQKSSQGSSYPMAGVPVNELTPYLKRLVERGYRVAIADQYETNGGHAREISKVVTPGTILETLDPSAHYLASIVMGEDEYGVAFVEVSVGNFYVTQVTDREELLSELYRFEPSEILLGPSLRNHEDFVETIKQQLDTQISNYNDDAFGPMKALHRTRDHFGEETLESLNIVETSPTVQAIGSVISYIDDTGTGVLESLTRLQTYETSENVTLDATTQRNLELTETMYGDSEGSLLETIDHTQTSSGYRLLREWIQRPQQNKETLQQRHQCVEALTKAPLERDKIQEQLADGYDLHRLTSKIVQGSADATDLKRLEQTLQTFPRIQEIIRSNPDLSNVPLHELVHTPDEDVLQTISSELGSALVEDPPQTIKEGGIFQHGYDDELDTVLEEYTDLQEWFDT